MTGVLRVGDEVAAALGDGQPAKLGVRDLAPALVAARDGATTVASTAHLAALARIRVFATGGLVGVPVIGYRTRRLPGFYCAPPRRDRRLERSRQPYPRPCKRPPGRAGRAELSRTPRTLLSKEPK